MIKSEIAADNNRTLGREDYYKYWIVKEDSTVADMHIDYKKNFVVETKKLIDLAYNYNMANSHKRYFFAPENMPTPLALNSSLRQDIRLANEDGTKDAVLRGNLIYKSQKTFHVPNTEKLSLPQVVLIQKTDEWKSYIKKQREVFDNPLKWNENTVKEYSTVLGNLYIKIKTDYKDFPFYENVYYNVHILIKIIDLHSELFGLNEIATVINVLDSLMELTKERVIRGVIKIKQSILNEKKEIIEEFSTGLRSFELSSDDLKELKRNFSAVEIINKKSKESNAQR
ncbi:MAG: hypothetical protein HQK93_03290 [Nitrospirae bacterium]|nr:hypothetical protein [Nitrospirota bacterium]